MKDPFLLVDSKLKVYQEMWNSIALFSKKFEIYFSMNIEERGWVNEQIICKYAMSHF